MPDIPLTAEEFNGTFGRVISCGVRTSLITYRIWLAFPRRCRRYCGCRCGSCWWIFCRGSGSFLVRCLGLHEFGRQSRRDARLDFRFDVAVCDWRREFGQSRHFLSFRQGRIADRDAERIGSRALRGLWPQRLRCAARPPCAYRHARIWRGFRFRRPDRRRRPDPGGGRPGWMAGRITVSSAALALARWLNPLWILPAAGAFGFAGVG